MKICDATDKEKTKHVAIHEAAHAVVGLLLGAPLDEVTIESEGNSLGHATNDYGDPYSDIGGDNWNLMARAISSYAGHMATRHLGYDEDDQESGAGNDYREACHCCSSIVGPDDERCLAMQESGIATARMMVDVCWPQIKLVASALEEERTMTGKEVEEFLRSCIF